MTILMTGATGMFGGALVKKLAAIEPNTSFKALVRSQEKARQQGLNQLKNLVLIEGDLLKPETLMPALQGVERIFLVTPMVPNLDEMEINLITAAQQEGVKHIFKLYGAVKHKEDHLIQLHNHVLEALQTSNLDWTLVSPNSVMETCFLPFAETIKSQNAIYGCTKHHKVGFVALEDVVHAAATLLTTPGHAGKNYPLTGPESLSLYDVAKCFSKHLGRDIQYIDMPEQEFGNMLLEFLGKSPDQIDMEIMCHMRAWSLDGADFVTDTYETITGKKPTTVAKWIARHDNLFRI